MLYLCTGFCVDMYFCCRGGGVTEWVLIVTAYRHKAFPSCAKSPCSHAYAGKKKQRNSQADGDLPVCDEQTKQTTNRCASTKY